ncbi:sulfurtransferase TusA family protein [Haloarcula sp. AONF1]
MVDHEPTQTLDVKGKNCPMPVVKAKQTVDELSSGDLLEGLATDPGSLSDIAGWTEATDGVELVEQEEGADVLKHYVRRTE